MKRKSLTVYGLAQIIGAQLKSEFTNSNAKVGRVLTQSNYVEPGDAVIASCWYDSKRIIDEALERGACIVFCDEETAGEYMNLKVVAVQNPLQCIERFEKWCEKGCNAKRITIHRERWKNNYNGIN